MSKDWVRVDITVTKSGSRKSITEHVLVPADLLDSPASIGNDLRQNFHTEQVSKAFLIAYRKLVQ